MSFNELYFHCSHHYSFPLISKILRLFVLSIILLYSNLNLSNPRQEVFSSVLRVLKELMRALCVGSRCGSWAWAFVWPCNRTQGTKRRSGWGCACRWSDASCWTWTECCTSTERTEGSISQTWPSRYTLKNSIFFSPSVI